MSLLMKALEKAAKDREDADAGRAAGKTEIALEPMIAAPAEPRAAAASPAPASPAPPPSATSRAPTSPPASVKPASATTPAAATQESMLAATVVRASERNAGGGLGNAVAYVRSQPLIVFGPIAALVLIGYGAYIYMNMTSPGMAVKQPPARAAAPGTPLAPAPAAAGGSTAAAPQPPIPVTALLSQLQEVATKGKPATKPAAAPAAPAPEPAPAPAAGSIAGSTAVRDTIKITSGDAGPTVNPLLARAYEVFSAGDFELAPQLYNRVLSSEPNNIDALLGLAAIATQRGDSDLASRYYVKVLEVEPRNSLAQAGLIGMLGRADPLAAESRLKQLIARDPSAYLHFTLGNLYADQNRWPDAQQAYFQAHHLQAGNPDYAYNLAVGLEHVGQPKLALEYYRRALELVAARGSANFGTAAVQERIVTLEKTVR